MVVVQLGPQERAALLRQHLDEGVPLTRLAAHAQVSGACQMVCVSRTERNGKNHDHDRREEP
ncbi:hypothetical protein, partial [Micrococcus luteus]|uniref:hypothetical protein n=2 Tax=Micrococcus TaxID=1269 RepID=UPI00230471A8